MSIENENKVEKKSAGFCRIYFKDFKNVFVFILA